MGGIDENKSKEEISYFLFFDILGFSILSIENPEVATTRLEKVYKIVNECIANENHQKIIFSDSVFVWGNNLHDDFNNIKLMWRKFFNNDCLVRGAIVQCEYRAKKGNYTEEREGEKEEDCISFKFNKEVAIAAGLESDGIKGPRIIVQNELAKRLVKKAWLDEIEFRNSLYDLMKKWNPQEDEQQDFYISQVPENSNYEINWMFDLKEYIDDRYNNKDEEPSDVSLKQYMLKKDFLKRVRVYKYTLKDKGQEQLSGIGKIFDRYLEKAEAVFNAYNKYKDERERTEKKTIMNNAERNESLTNQKKAKKKNVPETK